MTNQTIKALIELLMSRTTYAGDEGGSTDRMKKAGLPNINDEQYRKFFGDAVVRTGSGKKGHGSMILHRDCVNIEVTVDQGCTTTLPQYISSMGILAGIKVDAGMAKIGGQRLVGSVTELPDRLKQAVACGAKFTKFRFAYAPDTPAYVLEHGAMQMAAYCQASLEHGLVPYPEPELERSLLKAETDGKVYGTTSRMLDLLMTKLQAFGVDLGDIILKTNLMEFSRPQTPVEIALQTFELLKPWFEITGGVKLLSGGQSAEEAFSRTAALSQIVDTHAWNSTRSYPRLSTSFSRACMEGVLETWRDKGENEAKELFNDLSKQNSAALGL